MDYYKNFDFKEASRLIKMALKEDIGSGDITTDNLIPSKNISSANILLKEEGIISGLKIFKAVFDSIDKKTKIKFFVKDGDKLKKGTVIGKIKGSTRTLLKGERTALNILQRMSGISTVTNSFTKKLNNSKIKILDTRKTTPNFRLFEKLAVKIGGGTNHRTGLYDMMLIKDNHIEANGGIENTLERLVLIKKNFKVEIEVKDLFELMIVCTLGKGIVDIIMLDNFSIENVKEAVKIVNGNFKIEISGGINMDTISNYTRIKGIDFISIGALTHSAKSLDISLDFIN
ncbi:MAG: carboxylating nicotinate-nucleotide diphosphorylase [Ignavibacteria bacterium]|nr:carboxylating nicotinate-nucleotide diphosphorylase [Ignavibacteria bacterium]